MAIEEPSFTVVLKQPPFEVRDYGASVVAEVVVTGDQGAVGSLGFRRLAGYIFGGNKARKRIAMTAPVTMRPQVADRGMAWPADKAAASTDWAMWFTMPASYALGELPEPENPDVHLKTLPAARFAVLRFSGLTGDLRMAAKTTRLMRFVEQHRLNSIGPVALARYNPPWTPWFLRRNEIMVSVEAKV